MDLRLKHPFTCTVAGPTISGKTQFVFRLIRHADEMIDPPPERILYCYGEFQPSFAEFPQVEFHEGLPDVGRFDGRFRVLLIIDDLMNEADQNVCNIFTKLSHHRNVSVVFVTQNLFHRNKHVRTMNLNTHYLVLFQEPSGRRSGRDPGPTDVPRQEQVFGRSVQRRHERTARLPADRSETGNRRIVSHSRAHFPRRRPTVRVRFESIKGDKAAAKSRVKMSRRRVRQILPELKRLNRLTEKDRRIYLKTCGGPFVDCLCECIRSLLKGRMPLKSKQLKALRRYKRILRKAALKKTSRSERRRILQKGGFVGAILPPLISGLGALLGPVISRLVNRNG